jgi:hypothetical protein
MEPTEEFHGWITKEDDLQIQDDHIRVKDVDLPYYRIADVALAEPETDKAADLSRLIIRLGSGEEYGVSLLAAEAESARSVIQERAHADEGLWRDPDPRPRGAKKPPPLWRDPEPPPVPSDEKPKLWTEDLRSPDGWAPASQEEEEPGIIRRLAWAVGGMPRPALAAILSAVALVVLGILIMKFAGSDSTAVSNFRVPGLSPQVGRAHTNALPHPSRAAPSPSKTRHHRTHKKGAVKNPIVPTLSTEGAPATSQAAYSPAPQPSASTVPGPSASPSSQPPPTKSPSPPPTTQPSPSVSTSEPSPSPSVSAG